MTFLSSLRSRIFLTCALLAVLSIAAATYLVSVRVTRELAASVQREITATATLVQRLQVTRAQTYAAMAHLIADAPKLKAAVDTDDPATVQDIANDYQHELNSNLLLVTGKSGRALATVGTSPDAVPSLLSQPSFRNAMAGKETSHLVPWANGILYLTTVPIAVGISNPDVLGTLSVGFLLDDAFAGELKAITGTDLVFGMDGQILAGTLTRDDRAALTTLLQTGAVPANVVLHTEQYVALAVPLAAPTGMTTASTPPVALLLRSRMEQQRFLQAIHTELSVTALLAVLLATLLSFAVARTITRPLAAITGVMREVAATGDLTRKIALRRGRRWHDEDARLLATTFNTLTESIARAQREMSQKERLSSLGRLSTVIAHEVRNPLMIIKAALHTLRRPDLAPTALREAAADIDGEVIRLNRIVNEVLDFARPIRFEFGPTDLNTLVQESATAAQASPGAPVIVTVDARMPTLTTDAERLRVALINLIGNARDAVATQDGAQATAGAEPAVYIATHYRPHAVSIIVSDRGNGIDRSDLGRIFDPYFTTKRGGTGLGLPIARHIIDGLGGTLTAASEPGRGTEMRIELPFDAPAPTPAPRHAPTTCASATRRRRVRS